jgi:hypothetical protein
MSLCDVPDDPDGPQEHLHASSIDDARRLRYSSRQGSPNSRVNFGRNPMKTSMMKRGVGAGLLLVIFAAGAFVLFQVRAHAQAKAPAQGPQITQTVVLDNERFNVRRLTFPAGFRQTLHTVAANRDELVILITPAKFEGQVDDKKTVSDVPGTIWPTPKAPSQHAYANLSKQPIDILVVQTK